VEINSKNTKWIIILNDLTNAGDADRFLKTSVFIIQKLIEVGIKQEDIEVFCDDYGLNVAKKYLGGICHLTKVCINKIDSFASLAREADKHNAVIIVVGHGSNSGISGAHTISPYEFRNMLTSFKKVMNLVVILGQCYAGVFNNEYLEKTKAVVIGSTGFDLAIGSERKVNKIKWEIDTFIFHSIAWFYSASKLDLDGDGRSTIFDCFIYETTHTIEDNRKLKGEKYEELQEKSEQLKLRKNDEDLRKKIDGILNFYHSYQSPWILNQELARELVVSLSKQ